MAAPAFAGPNASLSGTVTSAGKPLANATVFVSRAWPIRGVAYYCPGCYLDCAKSATTDAGGRWTIAGLSDELKFELLVAARGHIPAYTATIVPAEMPTVDVALKARDIGALPKDQVVLGRVLGPDGDPVAGAVVDPEMVTLSEGGYGGAVEGLDPLAVTDEAGNFALAYDKPLVSMDLKVSARGLATQCFRGRAPKGVVHELRLTEGASVSGRLMHDRKPLRDVEVTMEFANRVFGANCYQRETIATDEDGRFLFTNILPQGKYVVIASGQQLLGWGCTIPKILEVSHEGEVPAGDLQVVPGVRVAGRVLPPPEGGVTPGSKLSLSSQVGWDSVTIDLPDDGRFEFPHVAPGEYILSLHAKGVYLSERNASFEPLNASFLLGRVDADIPGLVIETTTTRPERRSHSTKREIPELGGVEASPRKGAGR